MFEFGHIIDFPNILNTTGCVVDLQKKKKRSSLSLQRKIPSFVIGSLEIKVLAEVFHSFPNLGFQHLNPLNLTNISAKQSHEFMRIPKIYC